MRIHLAILPLAFCLSIASTLSAQANPSAHHPEQSWPNYKLSSGKLDVVTLADPTVRQPCKVKRLDAYGVICRTAKGQKPSIYKQEDIAALIETPTNDWLLTDTGIILLAGATIAASVFVPITAIAVVMQVMSGIMTWISVWDLLETAPGGNHDSLLYQRAGTTPAVALNLGR